MIDFPILDLKDPVDPRIQGRALDEFIRALEENAHPERTQALFAWLQQELGITDNDDPLTQAGFAIAEAMDEGALMNALPYHNVQHVHEVMLSVTQLVILDDRISANLTAHDKNLLLVAALIHDIDHDGQGNEGHAFKLENQSFKEAKFYLNEHHVDPVDQQRLHGLVLLTDLFANPRPVKAVRDYIASNAVAITPHAEWPDELAYLLDEEHAVSFAHQGTLLMDADILPSTGWGIPHYQVNSEKLSRETRGLVSKGLPGCIPFIETILEGRYSSTAAAFFQPNMNALLYAAKQAQMIGNQTKLEMPDSTPPGERYLLN